MHTKLWSENLNRIDTLEDPDEDVRIILRRTLTIRTGLTGSGCSPVASS
jgi:hypothetical protein